MRTPRASMGACMACTARVYPGAFDERALPGARRQLSKGRRHLRRGLLHAGRLRPTRQPRRQRCRLFGGALRCRPAVSRHARVAHSRHQLFLNRAPNAAGAIGMAVPRRGRGLPCAPRVGCPAQPRTLRRARTRGRPDAGRRGDAGGTSLLRACLSCVHLHTKRASLRY